MKSPRGLLGRFGRFLGVGAIGFLVDASVFGAALEVLHLGTFWSRLLAFVIAALATWALNRRFTFEDRASAAKASELGRYTLASLTAGAANLSTYLVVVWLLGTERPIPYVALMAGVGVGLAVNFLLYNTLVFRRRP